MPALQRHESATEMRELPKGDRRPARNRVRLEALHRRYGSYIGVAVMIAVVAVALWRPWENTFFFSPTNYVECQEQAARTAKSAAALRILIIVCSSKFPSRL
jgi:hypothetical protein